MRINELSTGTKIPVLIATIKSFGEERKIEATNRKVCDVIITDDSGEVTMSLWDAQIDLFKVGDVVKIVNGYCSTFKSKKNVSSGKFGILELVKS